MKQSYAQICQTHAVPVFHQDWWLDATGLDWDVAIAYNGKNVAGVLPYALEQKAGVLISRNPALTPYSGPVVFFPKNMGKARQETLEHNVVRQLAAMLRPAKVWSCAMRPSMQQAGLLKELGFALNVRQTFWIDLTQDEDTLQRNLAYGCRSSIRKAAEQGIEIQDEPHFLPMLYQYQKATLERKGLRIPYTAAYIQRLFDACYTRGQAACWVARKDGVPQAAIWHLWDEECAYFLVSGKNPDVRDSWAVSALVWHAILHSKKLGKRTFDFEGSMDPGIESFNRHFGPERKLYLVATKNESLRWQAIRALQGLRGR